MRFSLLPILAAVALALAAPAANARVIDQPAATRGHVWQDLRSPDARDAAGPTRAQIRRDLSRLNAGNALRARSLAAEKYYSSYGKTQPVQHTAARADDNSPWLVIGIGLGLIVLVAGSVAIAARTRRRTMRVAV